MENEKKFNSKVASPLREETPAKNSFTSKAGGIEVVLVDDSIQMRDHVVFSLSFVEGVTSIRQAGDVPSGLLLLEKRRPDVLILDIEMPGQSGLDLLKIARRRDFAEVIIILSIHDHPALRQRSKDLGANFYFQKLREFDRVAEVCRDLIASRTQHGDSPPPQQKPPQ